MEDVLEETQKLLNAIHASLSGDINYEWVKTVPTLRVDWRDGKTKPVVTWSRGNIEYKYDMSVDTLCINNEGLETILSSPVMADLMLHMASFSAEDKSLKEEDRGGKTPSFKLAFLKELCDITSNWPGSITEAFLPGRGLDGLGDLYTIPLAKQALLHPPAKHNASSSESPNKKNNPLRTQRVT